jgi:sec-independent protein translocase protein TatA
MLSPIKILLIVVLLLLFFGAGRVASLGKGLGESVRNFKKGLRGDDNDPPNRDGSGLPPGGTQ